MYRDGEKDIRCLSIYICHCRTSRRKNMVYVTVNPPAKSLELPSNLPNAARKSLIMKDYIVKFPYSCINNRISPPAPAH